MLLALVNKCALCLFYFRSTVGLHISQLLARIIYQFPHFLWSFVTFSGTRFCGFVIFVFAYFILFSNIKRVFNLDIWLPGMMHTGEIDSALWCTPAEIDSTVGCKPRSFLKIWMSQPNRRRIQKYFSLSCPCKWVRIMEKKEVKNLVSHALPNGIFKYYWETPTLPPHLGQESLVSASPEPMMMVVSVMRVGRSGAVTIFRHTPQ